MSEKYVIYSPNISKLSEVQGLLKSLIVFYMRSLGYIKVKKNIFSVQWISILLENKH